MKFILSSAFILGISLGNQVQAADPAFALRYGDVQNPSIAIISVSQWANDSDESKVIDDLPFPNLHLREGPGIFSGPSYAPTQAGDVIVLGETCKGCAEPLLLYRNGAFLKKVSGYGGALTHCESAEKSACYHMKGVKVDVFDLNTGASNRLDANGSAAILRQLLARYDYRRLTEKSPMPVWGAAIVPVAAAKQEIEQAAAKRQEAARQQLETSRQQELARQERVKQEQLKEAQIAESHYRAFVEALDITKREPVGTVRTCSSPQRQGMPLGTPIPQFLVSCAAPWPSSLSALPVSIAVDEFLKNGWELAQRDLVGDNQSGSVFIYLTVKKVKMVR